MGNDIDIESQSIGFRVCLRIKKKIDEAKKNVGWYQVADVLVRHYLHIDTSCISDDEWARYYGALVKAELISIKK